MNKLKCIFISVAVFTWVQIILVFLVECTVFHWFNSRYMFSHNGHNGPLVDAVSFFYSYDAEDVLLGWSITHFIFHTAWVVSSCVLFASALKYNNLRTTFSAKPVKQYAIITILVCICDLGACIHTSVFAAQHYDYNRNYNTEIFFPLFYSKIGAFWIYNVAVAVVMLDVLMKKNVERKRDSIKEDIAHHHNMTDNPNPAMAYQHQHQQQSRSNDLVDQFYTQQPMPATHQPMSEILPPPSQMQPKSYQNELNRPPYYVEYMQRQSTQPHANYEVPIPDY